MENNTNIIKALATVFVILYIVSPIDAVPGPIDDVLAALMLVAARRNQIG